MDLGSTGLIRAQSPTLGVGLKVKNENNMDREEAKRRLKVRRIGNK